MKSTVIVFSWFLWGNITSLAGKVSRQRMFLFRMLYFCYISSPATHYLSHSYVVSNLSAVISFYAALSTSMSLLSTVSPRLYYFLLLKLNYYRSGFPLVRWQTLLSLPHNMTPLYPSRAKIAFVCFTARSHIIFSSNFSSVFFISFLNSIQISFQVFPSRCISLYSTRQHFKVNSILFSAYSYSF